MNFEPSIVSRTIRKRTIPRHGDNSVQITTKQLRRLVGDTLEAPSENPRNQNWGQTRIARLQNCQ
jgi:hypothetical protein